MKKIFSGVALFGISFGLVLSACGDSNDSSFSPAAPGIGEISSDSNEGQLGDWSSSAGVPGLSSAGIPGGSSASNGTSSPVVQSSSSALDVPASSAQVPPASSAATVIPHFEGNSPVFFSEVSPTNANLKDNDGNDPGWVEF